MKKTIKIIKKNKETINDLYSKKILKLIPANPNKKLESEHIYPFYTLYKNEFNIYHIPYNNQSIMNLNHEILKSYETKPDIIIISFDKKPYIPILEIPKFPIYYHGNIYLTPILIEQFNGFSNKIKNKELIFIDFIGRIYQEIGVILSTSNFVFFHQQHDDSGISNMRNGILKNHNVSKIDKWMTRYIPKHTFGWMAEMNKYTIDYVFDNYTINNVGELGIYMGYSTEYINLKNRNMKHYCFDRYDNLFLTDYINEQLTPLDTNFFYKYLRYETFHSNLSEAKNVYTIKGDNYQSIDFLHKNKIPIDFFYIDFIKQNKKIISFIEKIFKYYPEVIIVGDDGIYLQDAMKILEKKYNCINFYHCYLCKKNKSEWKNINTLLTKYEQIKSNNNIKDVHDLLKKNNIEMIYKINYVVNQIKKKVNIDKIMKYIEILNINCNETNITTEIQNGGNLYHFIANYRFQNDKYAKKLYSLLIKKQKDMNEKNMLNLTPIDYFNYFITFK